MDTQITNASARGALTAINKNSEPPEKAMELLQCTGMKIGEITELCGYKDQYYFSHCFKKLTGVSPNKYRREHEQA